MGNRAVEYPDDYCPCGGSTTTGCDPSTFCWVHYVHEPIPARSGAYRVCFECNHVYATARDLLAEYAAVRAGRGDYPLAVLPQVDDIGFCPFCLHDW